MNLFKKKKNLCSYKRYIKITTEKGWELKDKKLNSMQTLIKKKLEYLY